MIKNNIAITYLVLLTLLFFTTHCQLNREAPETKVNAASESGVETEANQANLPQAITQTQTIVEQSLVEKTPTYNEETVQIPSALTPHT